MTFWKILHLEFDPKFKLLTFGNIFQIQGDFYRSEVLLWTKSPVNWLMSCRVDILVTCLGRNLVNYPSTQFLNSKKFAEWFKNKGHPKNTLHKKKVSYHNLHSFSSWKSQACLRETNSGGTDSRKLNTFKSCDWSSALSRRSESRMNCEYNNSFWPENSSESASDQSD